jgi:hypothetical protein
VGPASESLWGVEKNRALDLVPNLFRKKDTKERVPIKKKNLVYSFLRHCLELKRFIIKNIQNRSILMSNQVMSEYLVVIVCKYQKATKREKSQILDHAQDVTGFERKHLIKRLLNREQRSMGRKTGSGHPLQYSKAELLPHIKYLWEKMERICAPRIKAGLSDWLKDYKDCSGFLKLLMVNLSASTLDRYLSEVKVSLEVQKGLSTTCPARYMKSKVPINTLDASISKPGFVQMDTKLTVEKALKAPL